MSEFQRLQQQMQQRQQLHEAALSRLQQEENALNKANQDHQQRRQELNSLMVSHWPRPSWLPEEGLHLAFVGASGAGKSSLINCVMNMLPSDSGAAAIGVQETTMQPQCYPVDELTGLCLWDLPGSGTRNFPTSDYIKRFGLRHFCGIVIVIAGRFTEIDLALYQEACTWDLPYYLVRTKADLDIDNNYTDKEQSPEATMEEIRTSLELELGRDARDTLPDLNRMFIITTRASKYPFLLRPHFERFFNCMMADVAAAWESLGYRSVGDLTIL